LKKASFASKVASGQPTYVNFSTFNAHERPCLHCVALRYDITLSGLPSNFYTILGNLAYVCRFYKCETIETWYNNTVLTLFRSTRTGNTYKRNFGAGGLSAVKSRIQLQGNEICKLTHFPRKPSTLKRVLSSLRYSIRVVLPYIRKRISKYFCLWDKAKIFNGFFITKDDL